MCDHDKVVEALPDLIRALLAQRNPSDPNVGFLWAKMIKETTASTYFQNFRSGK